MESMCDNCPFAKSGDGLKLRKSLGPGRWASILAELRAGLHFHCHKTTGEEDEEGNPDTSKSLVCAGSIAWQEKHNCVSQLARIVERLELFKGRSNRGDNLCSVRKNGRIQRPLRMDG